MTEAALTVRANVNTLVSVPMRRQLGTSVTTMSEVPLLLVDLHTEERITGHAYLFCYRASAGHAVAALLRDVSSLLAGTAATPAAVRQALGFRFRLLGVSGLVSSALAGVDIACWDAVAIAAGLPVTRLLGAISRSTSAYNSNGLGVVEPSAAPRRPNSWSAKGSVP